MRIRETKGLSHSFTLKNKSTFRLLPYEETSIEADLISEEIEKAQKLGEVAMFNEPTTPQVKNTKKEVSE